LSPELKVDGSPRFIALGGIRLIQIRCLQSIRRVVDLMPFSMSFFFDPLSRLFLLLSDDLCQIRILAELIKKRRVRL
jgi:hypothetical protein